MSTPGRKPKPTAQRKLQGNPGKRALPADEPRLEPHRPRKPRGLNDKQPAAAKFYDAYAAVLEEAGITTQADEPAFRLMAMHYAFAIEAGATLAREGLMDEDERGLSRKHPMAQVWRDNSTMALKYMEQFGMTPSSRTRVKDVTAPVQLGLGDMLAQVIFEAEQAADD